MQRRLQALQAICPDCDDFSRFPAGFTAHLSVSQFPSLSDCQRTQEQLQSRWQPITFSLNEVVMLAREPDGAFNIAQRVALGASGTLAPSSGR